MTNATRVRLAMALRVRDLLVANPFGYQPGDEVAAQLVKKVGRAQELLTQKETGEQASRNSTRHRQELRRTMTRVTLRHLLKIAKALAVTHPDVASGIQQPPLGRSEEAFLAGVRAIVQGVETQKDLFLQYGLSEEGLAELKQQLASYEQSVKDANGGRRAHTGAQAELRTLSKELVLMVQQLDGIVGYQFRDKPELLGAWKSARNVAWPVAGQAKPDGGIKLEKPAA